MNNVSIYKFEGIEITTVIVGEEPMFVATGVTEALNYHDGNLAVEEHVLPEDVVTLYDNCLLVTEDVVEGPITLVTRKGLYALIANAPAGNLKFKKWILGEVLRPIQTKIEKAKEADPLITVLEALIDTRKQNQSLENRLEKLETLIADHDYRIDMIERK